MFQKGRAQTAAMRFLANPSRGFEVGPVVSIAYWGRDTKGGDRPGEEGDVFDVKFAHAEYTFYISPAGANGKIRAWAFGTNPPVDQHQHRLSPV